jgi:hypothetical protein
MLGVISAGRYAVPGLRLRRSPALRLGNAAACASNGQEILRATGGAGRGVIVFKMRTSAPSTAEIAHKVIDRLSGLGYEDFTCQEPTFADQQATRLESPRAAVG